MSDGDRHGYITFGWVATIVGVLLFFGFQSSYYTNAQKSAEYAAKCGEQYEKLSASPPNVAATPGKKIEPASAEKNQSNPDWCDLAAQQSMAESTYWMNWAAIATTIFTGIGAFLIWRTLLATQDTIAETRRIGEAQVRAYLHCEGGSFSISNSNALYNISITNAGQSPALNCKVRCIIYISRPHKGNYFADMEVTPYADGRCPAIMATQTANINCGISIGYASGRHVKEYPERYVAQEIMGALVDRELPHHYVIFTIGWDDVFGKRQNIQGTLSEDSASKTCKDGSKSGRLITLGPDHYKDRVYLDDNSKS